MEDFQRVGEVARPEERVAQDGDLGLPGLVRDSGAGAHDDDGFGSGKARHDDGGDGRGTHAQVAGDEEISAGVDFFVGGAGTECEGFLEDLRGARVLDVDGRSGWAVDSAQAHAQATGEDGGGGEAISELLCLLRGGLGSEGRQSYAVALASSDDILAHENHKARMSRSMRGNLALAG